MFFIHVTEGNKPPRSSQVIAVADPPTAYDGFGKFIGRRPIANAPKNMSWNDRKCSSGKDTLFQETTPIQAAFHFHNIRISIGLIIQILP
jgi:hypothetical protein